MGAAIYKQRRRDAYHVDSETSKLDIGLILGINGLS